MNLPSVNGQLVSLVTTAISLVLAFLTAFHVFAITDAESGAIMVVATAAVGLGLYVYSILHSWATSSYDLSRATTLLTALVAAVVALLDAFGVFHFNTAQQSALLGVAGGIAFLGGLVYSYLHTAKQVAARVAALHAQRMREMNAPQTARRS